MNDTMVFDRATLDARPPTPVATPSSNTAERFIARREVNIAADKRLVARHEVNIAGD
tara:strand:+ start:1094 stop:1264 length:171 start_codon:yes stop_codon:yes gene_type:complete